MEDSTRVFLADRVDTKLKEAEELLGVLRKETPDGEYSMSFITDVSDHLYETRDAAGSLYNTLKTVMEENDASEGV